MTILERKYGSWSDHEISTLVNSLSVTLSRYFQKPAVLILSGKFTPEQIKETLGDDRFMLEISTVSDAANLPFFPAFLA